MILLKSAGQLRTYIQKAKDNGASTGFVPTMGALHEGHISLVAASRAANDLTVCSIFVNPTQFNNADDFKRYPITIESDINILEKNGCDLLFLPSVEEIYIPGTSLEKYELGYLETVLEGKFRPGHFQGVCQVVDRLLQIVQPARLYLGQKDFQQCMVIKKLVELKQHKTSLEICATLREPSGLAMSSRNKRLSDDQKEKALHIYKALLFLKNNIAPGSLVNLKRDALLTLSASGFIVDYVEIADASNLGLLDNWDGQTPVVAVIAAFIDDIRLIDNMLLN